MERGGVRMEEEEECVGAALGQSEAAVRVAAAGRRRRFASWCGCVVGVFEEFLQLPALFLLLLLLLRVPPGGGVGGGGGGAWRGSGAGGRGLPLTQR